MTVRSGKIKRDWSRSDRGRGITPITGNFATEYQDLKTGETYSAADLPPTVEFLCDWLTFSYSLEEPTKFHASYEFPNCLRFKVEADEETFNNLLTVHGIDSYKPAVRAGNQGYDRRLFWEAPFQAEGKQGGISCYAGHQKPFDGIGSYDKNGVPLMLFDMSGTGCRFLDAQGVDWKKYFSYIIEDLHCRVSRLDWSFDLLNTDLKDTEILEKLIHREILTPYGTFEPTFKSSSKTGEFKKFVVDLGDKNGDKSVTIYDKKLEREAAGFAVPFQSWIRIEFHFRHERAVSFIKDLLTHWDSDEMLADFLAAFLWHEIDFLEAPPNSKIIRDGITDTKARQKWKKWPKWQAILGDIKEKSGMRRRPPMTTTIAKQSRWIEEDVSKAEARLNCADPDIYEFKHMTDILDGYQKFESKDIEIINTWRKQRRLPEITEANLREKIERLKFDIEDMKDRFGIVDEEEYRFNLKREKKGK